MHSPTDEDVQVLLDQSGDEHVEGLDSGHMFTYNIALEYKPIRPSENMRVIEPLDEDSDKGLLQVLLQESGPLTSPQKLARRGRTEPSFIH
ncbi:hypothetical protein JCGZ_17166 [Jatropha curcas]|uniref:Uncharacterized protein n=1 Tax=Jatropha curcas TaxID=180498 RepID=A0A067K264_JATCU|nr:hypothetical protein JCGZ_17166 [Jatropha curcas]